MRAYKIKTSDRLFFTTAAVKGKNGVVTLTMLVDTGSTYTILPWEYLAPIGYRPPFHTGQARIVTASGLVVAPKVEVEWFSCFGLKLEPFALLAHTLPWNFAKFGILGMDFLQRAKAQIDVGNAQVLIAAE